MYVLAMTSNKSNYIIKKINLDLGEEEIMRGLEIEFNPNAMALVLSDVHLGALHTKKSFFDLFLSSLCYSLEKEKLKNLKALIILGDCFDLIMDTHQDLLQFGVYQNILDKFNQLHENPDFNLVFALGNHEVPVVDNYDNNFFTNKDKMLKKFDTMQDEMGLNYSFFKNDIFTQYVLLQPEEYGKSEPLIKLFDTRQDIVKDKAVNTLPLGVKTQSTEFNNYFMAHGYQFDPGLAGFARIWNLGLMGSISFIKQIGDRIWNGFIRKIYKRGKKLVYFAQDKIDQMVKKITDKYIKKKNLNTAQKQEVHENVNIKCKSENHREAIRENEESIKKIVEFLPDLISMGYDVPINHVIYGHTHDTLRPVEKWFSREVQPSINQFQVDIESEERKFSISNTGAWQHVEKPSFIEIHTDWKVNTQEIPTKIQKVEKIIER